MKGKEKNVTPEILESVRATLKNHTKDANDYLKGIKLAEDYLRSHVEKAGLFKYVNETMNSEYTESGERLLCYDLYDEVNRSENYESKDTPLSGETV
jgi:hypothetical protein